MDFKNNRNKKAYAYYFTSQSTDEKARVTLRFLKQKAQEYEPLKQELQGLRCEAGAIGETK